jgi:hypothetical protein
MWNMGFKRQFCLISISIIWCPFFVKAVNTDVENSFQQFTRKWNEGPILPSSTNNVYVFLSRF